MLQDTHVITMEVFVTGKDILSITPGKNFPLTGPFGPYLVTSDEVGDYTKLPIETRLNGEVMQKQNCQT